MKVLIQIPKFIFGIIKEHFEIKKIIKKYNIDLIISDNRYGLYSKKVPTIFITHQIAIKLPVSFRFAEKAVYKLHKKFIQKFDKCFIPDVDSSNNLSGDLSHKYPVPVNAGFIGLLSRFKYKTSINYSYDLMFIISGPEPQRSIFEKKIFEQTEKLNKRILIVAGKPGVSTSSVNSKYEYRNHLNTEEMQDAILESEIVICRSGYTSVMDLMTLKKKAILIPTDGQTEQEYLAKYLSEKKLCVTQKLNDFNIYKAIVQLFQITEFKADTSLDSERVLKIIRGLIY